MFLADYGVRAERQPTALRYGPRSRLHGKDLPRIPQALDVRRQASRNLLSSMPIRRIAKNDPRLRGRSIRTPSAFFLPPNSPHLPPNVLVRGTTKARVAKRTVFSNYGLKAKVSSLLRRLQKRKGQGWNFAVPTQHLMCKTEGFFNPCRERAALG
jgi:hypothetical protein